MTAIDQLSLHEPPVVERRVGTACGITLEIRRTDDDGLALVALPTIEGCSVIVNSATDDLELIKLIGDTMLRLFSKTAPLLTGEHFQPRRTTVNFGV